MGTNKWVSVSEFLEIIKNKEFIQTSQGDIYIKSISNKDEYKNIH